MQFDSLHATICSQICLEYYKKNNVSKVQVT